MFSHTGSDSRYFNREGRYGAGGAYRDPNSPYRSWYDFDSEYMSAATAAGGALRPCPKWTRRTPSYVRLCLRRGRRDRHMAADWGASGFRLDVADELPDDFIEKIRAAVKAGHGEDKLLHRRSVGGRHHQGRRSTTAAPTCCGHGLDSRDELPVHAMQLLAFARGEDASAVARARSCPSAKTTPNRRWTCAMNFLSTHDTERGITAIAGEPANGRDRYWQSKRMHPRRPHTMMPCAALLLAYAMHVHPARRALRVLWR